MKKIEIGSTILLQPFKYHDSIKHELLYKINNSYSDNLNVRTEYYGDSIGRLDWSKNLDYSREWIKLVKPKLEEHFDKCAKTLYYQKCHVKGMWYQQYVKNDSHGWHTHSENYTGVYYLEFPEGASRTELVDQFNIYKKITIDCKEGDVVIFPSYIIHRSPKIEKNLRKTIISFNLEFEMVDRNIFCLIDNL